ncbi:hypothetical protein KC948_10275 [Proteus mirabilis]
MLVVSNMKKHHVQIIPATHEHIVRLLPHVRQADVDEFYAMSMQTPEQVLRHGLSVSTKAYAGIINEEVVTIFGVASGSLLTGLGVPWLVGTDLLEQHQKTFLRRCKPILKQMLGQYPTLMNYVDERNHIAKAWLHWLGFQIEEAKPAGLLQLPFHRFTLRAK